VLAAILPAKGEKDMTDRKLRWDVDFVLQIHLEETGHDIQFREEWIYDTRQRQPHLSEEAHQRIILRGNTRFQAAQAWIEGANGERFVQSLGPICRDRSRLETAECSVAIGKPRRLHQGCVSW
jgi:hypothetical protein